MLFSTKIPCSVASVALLCKLPQFYANLKNLSFAINKNIGIGESKPKQSRRQGESAPELPVGRAYAVESLAASKVLSIRLHIFVQRVFSNRGTIGWDRLTLREQIKRK